MRRKINKLRYSLDCFAQKGQWQKTLIKIILSDLFWVLFFSFFFRIYLYSNLKDTLSLTDSSSYIDPQFDIFKGEVDLWRTPVYPYFLRLIKYFTNEVSFVHKVVLIQSVISFLVIIVFYDILKKILIQRKLIIFATLLFAFSPSIVTWDKCILTESLSISFMVFFTWLFLKFQEKPSITKCTIISAATFFAIMLRPSFMILLPVLIFYWVFRIFKYKNQFKICFSGILTSLFIVALLFLYSNLNNKQNGYNGITAVQNFNQLYFLVDHKIFTNGNDDEISNTIQNSLRDKSEDIWHTKTMSLIFSKYSQKRISEFVKKSIINQPGLYFKKILNIFYYSKNERISVNYANRYNYFANFFDFILDINLFPFMFVYIFLIFVLMFYLYIYITHNVILEFQLVFWTIISLHIALIIANGGGQLSRLFIVMLPCLLIQLFYFIDRVLCITSIDSSNILKFIDKPLNDSSL